MSYIGSTPTSQNFISGTDYFSGTGSQTAFTLTRTVNSVNDIEVVINNVVQQPSTAYTLSGTTITFTSAPSSGTNNIYVRYLATTMQSITVPANSITRTQLDSNLQAGFQGRNKIINGHMVVDQRNAGAAMTTSGGYPVDRFVVFNGMASATFSSQRSSTAPAGFSNSLYVTCTAAGTSNAGAYSSIRQPIEGYNVADLNWGTANAKTVTLSFWVRGSLTGNYGVILRNDAGTTAYVAQYTINSANTWEQKTITVAGPTSGTFNTDNTCGINILWDIGAGSTYSQTASSTWYSSGTEIIGLTGGVKLLANLNANLYITGVQLEEGTQATSFERESYSVTLQKCQRYCNIIAFDNNSPVPASWFFDTSTSAVGDIFLNIPMRTVPTAAQTATSYRSNSASINQTITATIVVETQTTNRGIRLSIAGYSGATAGQGTNVRVYGSATNSYFGLTAEL